MSLTLLMIFDHSVKISYIFKPEEAVEVREIIF